LTGENRKDGVLQGPRHKTSVVKIGPVSLIGN